MANRVESCCRIKQNQINQTAAAMPGTWNRPSDSRGEEALSSRDKIYLKFADDFEKQFISQGEYENRDIEKTLDIAWDLLAALSESELKRIDPATVKQFHPKYRSGMGK